MVDDVTRVIAERAADLLAALDDDQRRLARGSLDDPALTEWSYVPGNRAGLSLEHLSEEQRVLAVALLNATGSASGAETTGGAIEVERIRRELVTGQPVHGDRFWVRVLGEPGGPAPWGWRINGHHLALHAVVADGRLTVTPHFVGAEPAEVRIGLHAGRRLLGPEEDLARELVESLDPHQRRVAVPSDRAPHDILTRADPVAGPTSLPEGITRGQLALEQQRVLDALVRRYLDRAPTPYAEACWDDAVAAELDRIGFTWLGSTERGQGHYYCVSAPDFLIEYDNTQDDANHAHSVWRHLRDDWGGDLLREHYARAHQSTG